MITREDHKQEATITCMGRDCIQRDFICRYYQKSTGWTFNVYSVPIELAKDFFELTLVIFNTNSLMVDSIQCNKHYCGMGIPDVLLPLASRTSGMQIVSSSNIKKIKENEKRSQPATKMWERLVAQGLAQYQLEEDRYFLKL